MLNDKMLAVMGEVNGMVAEREELIEAIAIALLAKKNLFILGDTGQAKSQVINLFRKRIRGAKQFERLLSKQADEEQLFGRIDLSSLIPGNADPEVLEQDTEYQKLLKDLEDCDVSGDDATKILDALETRRRRAFALHGNKPRLITSGKIPDSHIVFLDEVFKSNDGILNALLTALNERVFTNEGKTVELPVISFFAASNEIPNFNNPEEQILKPLYDRLELKLVTEYVKDRSARIGILKNKLRKAQGQPASDITIDELYSMQEGAAAVGVPDSINELMDDILCELREKGIHISDRKYFSFHPLVQAYAWLYGRTEVTSSDLLILRHYLWTSPAERTVINEVLERKCINPLKDELRKIHQMALECYKDFEDSAGMDVVRRIGKLRSEFISLYEMLQTLFADARNDEILLIDHAVADLESLSRQAHEGTSFTYTPLSELFTLGQIS